VGWSFVRGWGEGQWNLISWPLCFGFEARGWGLGWRRVNHPFVPVYTIYTTHPTPTHPPNHTHINPPPYPTPTHPPTHPHNPQPSQTPPHHYHKKQPHQPTPPHPHAPPECRGPARGGSAASPNSPSRTCGRGAAGGRSPCSAGRGASPGFRFVLCCFGVGVGVCVCVFVGGWVGWFGDFGVLGWLGMFLVGRS
jgi:hypothetical protein